MTSDNGPKDGDFVRYIDALMTSRAATVEATAPNPPSAARPPAPPSMAPGTTAAVRPPPAVVRMPVNTAPVASGTAPWVAIVALVVGGVLLLIGFAGATVSMPFVAAGFAIVYWTVGRLVKRARAGVATPQRPR